MEIVTQEVPLFFGSCYSVSIQAHLYTSHEAVFLAAWAHKGFFASSSKSTDKQSPGKSSLADSCTEEITQV